MQKKRALITGINGFTGQYLAAELSSYGYDVVGLGSTGISTEVYKAVNLLDREVVFDAVNSLQAEIVFHLAGVAFVGDANPNSFYQVNVQGTRNLLEALESLKKKPIAVLLASSANVYGNTVGEKLSESTFLNPANDYAVSKLAMEYMAKLWMSKLPVIIARPFNYTGVGQSEKFLIPKIVTHFKQCSAVIELGNLDVWRDFSDVRAVVNIYRRLVEAKAFGMVVNVCSGKSWSLREILGMCKKITGHDMEVSINRTFVRENEIRMLCGDTDFLQKVVGSCGKNDLYKTLEWMLKAT